MLVVCVSTFMLLLDTTVVNLALADLQTGLGASLGQLQWVIDAYLLTLGTFLLLAGAAGDRFGQRRLFVWGLTVFTAGSLACALAPTVAVLVAARAAQGVGGALLLGIGLPLLRRTFQGSELTRAVGLFGASIGLATAIGPLVGGGLTDLFGWRAIFVINIPIGAACLVVTLMRLVPDRPIGHGRLDLGGSILIGVSLAMLIYALIEVNMAGWTSPRVLVALAAALVGFAAALVGFAALIATERRRASPLIPRDLLAKPRFRAAGMAAFVSNGLLVGASALIALYFQNTLGESPLAAGLRFLSLSFTAFLAGILGGRAPFTSIPLTVQMVVSLAATSVGLGALMLAGPSMTLAVTIPAFALAGLGMGIGSVSLSRIALEDAAPEHAGVSAGVVNTARQLGASLGVAAFGAVFAQTVTTRMTDQLDRTTVPASTDPAQLIAEVASGIGIHATKNLTEQARTTLDAVITTSSHHGLLIVLASATAAGLVTAAFIAILANVTERR